MDLKITSQFQEAYNEQYSDKTAIWRELGAQQKVQNILDISAGQSFENVLEVGAGDGSILKLLDQKNYAKNLNAVEISKSGLEQILSKNIKSLQSATLFDGYKLPFADKQFDLIILSHVLEHVEHERILLREIHRVARFAIIEVPKDYRFGADKKLKHFLAYGHINLYTPTFLKYLLLTENFKIKKEITRLYHQKTFLFGKESFIEKLKANLSYFGKMALTNTPFKYINHKFINTITLLVESESSDLRIF
jgi:ubiquinone/menaquinone biosynthesis C-methylase UbiE